MFHQHVQITKELTSIEESVSQLVSLYQLVKQGEGSGLNDATQNIQEFNKNPESIFVHIHLGNQKSLVNLL